MHRPLSHQTADAPLSLWRAISPWIVAAVLLALLPAVLTQTSTLTILNQMAITVVFALSYNMLLGQAGMLSFGHAVYLGFGGFFAVHMMNHIETLGLMIPLPLLPLFSGLFATGMAMIIGAFSTRRSGVVFAMISLGVVELIASYAIIGYSFFRGGGLIGDRTMGPAVFGVSFRQQIEVYYLLIFWMLLSVAAMYLFTRTPVGRMANAVRDNPERAEFLGYSARLVRFISFCGAGFFAGVAGGLFAINYEIASAETLSVQASGTILMVTFLGGIGFFFGPVLGAVVFTLLQTVLSLQTDLWQLYVGVLFLAAVMFFPAGLAGVLMAHRAALHRVGWRALGGPYLRCVGAGLVGVLGVCAVVELVFHSRHLAYGGEALTLFWITVQTDNPAPWGIALVVAVSGLWGAKRQAPALLRVWQGAREG